jgi:hypothetical protein
MARKRTVVARSDRCEWTPNCKRAVDLYLRRGKLRIGICWECWCKHCVYEPLPKGIKVKA